jgi:hypothetical protein
VVYVCILFVCRWTQGWPKHVEVQRVYKLILVYLCAFVGGISVHVFLLLYVHIMTIYTVLCWTHCFASLHFITRGSTLQAGRSRIDFGSSSYALQLWGSFGLLNDDLPFGAILDMFWPLNNLHPSYVIPDVIFPSGLWSSCERFPFIHFVDLGWCH